MTDNKEFTSIVIGRMVAGAFALFVILTLQAIYVDLQHCHALDFDGIKGDNCYKDTNYNIQTGAYDRCYMPLENNTKSYIWCMQLQNG